jgi:hypothetical protein
MTRERMQLNAARMRCADCLPRELKQIRCKPSQLLAGRD